MRRLWLVLLAVLSAVPAQAATYYVATATSSPAGNNAAVGDITHPWLTLNYALSHVNCGDTILVRAGSYALINTQTVPARTCASFASPVTLKAYTGEVVHLPSIVIGVEHYIIFQDLFLDGIYGGQGETISIAGGYPTGTGGGHIRFVNCDIHGNNTTPSAPGGWAGANGGMINSSIVSLGSGGAGSNEFLGGKVHDIAYPFPAYLIDGYNDGTHGRPGTPHCFYVESPSNLIDGVEITRCANYAIHNIYYNASNNVYCNNYIHHTGTANQTGFAILLSTGSNNLACNNLIVWNANGIQAGDNGQKYYNNTVAFNGLGTSCGSPSSAYVYAQCYPAVLDQGTSDEFKNNIFFGNYNDGLSLLGVTPVCTNNIATSPPAACTGTVTADPAFVNGSGSYSTPTDFAIAGGSPAAAAGLDLSATFTTAYGGATRPATWSIGAYDLGAGNNAPNGVIDSPANSPTIRLGGFVTFAGTGTDADSGETATLTYAWAISCPSGTSSYGSEDPGPVRFTGAGKCSVTFTVTDIHGTPDASPDTRTVTVIDPPALYRQPRISP